MEISELLKLLNAQQVEYVIIGAHACAAHGHIRSTQDIDILINPTDQNIRLLKKALEKFGYDTTDASIEDFKTKKILFRQYWLNADFHPFAKGAKTETILKNKISGKYEKIPVKFASLKDLIKMKRAAGRPKDLEDLKYLLEIKKQKEKN